MAGQGCPRIRTLGEDFRRELAKQNRQVKVKNHDHEGVLIGFESEDDWFDYRIENHPEFLRRIAESRLALQKGLGIPLEDLDANAAQQNVAAGKPRRG